MFIFSSLIITLMDSSYKGYTYYGLLKGSQSSNISTRYGHNEGIAKKEKKNPSIDEMWAFILLPVTWWVHVRVMMCKSNGNKQHIWLWCILSCVVKSRKITLKPTEKNKFLLVLTLWWPYRARYTIQYAKYTVSKTNQMSSFCSGCLFIHAFLLGGSFFDV